MSETIERPPEHLSAASQAFWRRMLNEYALDEAPARELLRLACEALDRCEEARAVLAADGLVTTDRYGQSKPHPAAAVEQSSRLAVARLLRELRVLEPVPDAESRVGRLGRVS